MHLCGGWPVGPRTPSSASFCRALSLMSQWARQREVTLGGRNCGSASSFFAVRRAQRLKSNFPNFWNIGKKGRWMLSIVQWERRSLRTARLGT